MPVNESIAYKSPGSSITAKTTAAVTGKRFVKVTGNRTGGGGGGLSSDLANVYQVGLCTVSGEAAVGVSKYDAANGSLVGIHADPGIIVPVTAGAIIAAGAEVQTDASGQAITLAAGRPLGYCMNGAAAGADAEISLY